jgi:hypothetical protein
VNQPPTTWANGPIQISVEAAQRANDGVSRHDFQVLVDDAPIGTFQPAGMPEQKYTPARSACRPKCRKRSNSRA